jgi:hypothetical protein
MRFLRASKRDMAGEGFVLEEVDDDEATTGEVESEVADPGARRSLEAVEAADTTTVAAAAAELDAARAKPGRAIPLLTTVGARLLTDEPGAPIREAVVLED